MKHLNSPALRQAARFWRLALCLVMLLASGTVSSGARAQTAPAVQATYRTTSDWSSGFNGEISFTSAAALGNWKLAFDWPHRITSIWDAVIESRVGNRYVIRGAAWNASVAAGGRITFGFGGSPGKVTNGPTNFALSGTAVTPVATATPVPVATATPVPVATATPLPNATPTPRPPTAGVAVTITQNASWSGGFGASLEIQNNSAQAISGWALKFDFAPEITSLWNGVMTRAASTYTVRNEGWNGSIAPGATITLGFNGTGELTTSSASNATLNGVACSIRTIPGSSNPTPVNPSGSNIVIGGVDAQGEALQITIAQGTSTFPLSLSKGDGTSFSVAANNPSVVGASIVNGALQLRGLKAGRSGLRIQEGGGAARYVGVRVKTASGALPGLPAHLALGSVSEDTDDHLDFWRGFGTGATNRYVDARYIYLNGGHEYGWATWTNVPGDRARRYIRESKKLGMIPIFVWYNIPDGGESYTTDLEHVQSAAYMKEYYKLLKLFLDIVRAESPDEPVVVILEPDFLGYMAQNAGKPASQIAAQTSAAYTAGVLRAGVDPTFPNSIAGVVQSINYIIARDTPQSVFGWQMNLWASPAGGWTTPVPGKGLMHLTDNQDVASGRVKIYQEARAITQYYLDAGIKSHGAHFVSIDKYGLDAASAEAAAAQDPAGSTWFWNSDQWNNYLVFVRAMHDASQLPIVLWQLPVGHINRSQAPNPYNGGALFPELRNMDRQGEDSAPTFFFGDEFLTTGARYTHFSQNRGGDAGLSTSAGAITWGSHMEAAHAAGVSMALFGAGVGASTTNVGSPPSDGLWWIVKAQGYLSAPVAAGGN